MYLDCDTTPALKSRHVSKAYALDMVIKIATDLIAEATDGQIGIYDNPRGDGFHGYVIKYAGETPYFEAAEEEESA